MNVLLSAVGRRVEIVKAFKQELNKRGHKLFATDIDEDVPALYFADDFAVGNEMTFNFDYIMTLVDSELEEFANDMQEYAKQNVIVLQSNSDIIRTCYDKLEMYNTWKDVINIPYTSEFPKIHGMTVILDNSISKKRKGSASIGYGNYYSDDNITQNKIKGTEYNVSCYFDFYTEKLIDLFMCEKLLMRAGETERALSCWKECVFNEVKKLETIKGFKGFIDIDIIVDNDNKPWIIDINPRIGGGYPFAYLCGKNYFKYLVNNIEQKVNEVVKETWHYSMIKMFKYQSYFIKDIV